MPVTPTNDRLPHGYDLDTLASITHAAVNLHFSRWLPAGEATDAAAYGIITRLYEPGPAPSWRDLLAAGRDASSREVHHDRQAHGLTGPAGFTRYWHVPAGRDPEWLERLLDRITLGQVWPCLPQHHQAVLEALADHGTHQAAADAIGCSYGSWTVRLSRARREARRVWFWPETVPAFGHDRRDKPGKRTLSATASWGQRRRARRGKDTAA